VYVRVASCGTFTRDIVEKLTIDRLVPLLGRRLFKAMFFAQVKAIQKIIFNIYFYGRLRLSLCSIAAVLLIICAARFLQLL